VQGINLTDITDPFLSVGRFLAIMSVPLKDARMLAKNQEQGGDELDDAAYGIMDALPLGEIGETVKEINDYVRSQMQTQVHGSVPESEGDADSAPASPKN